MKVISQVEEMLSKLKRDRENYNTSSLITSESNHNEGWIESLEIIVDLLNRNRLEVANRRIQGYRDSLDKRYQNDLEVYGKDITNGWLEGSIEVIDWFYED